jgi:hypothetical protein
MKFLKEKIKEIVINGIKNFKARKYQNHWVIGKNKITGTSPLNLQYLLKIRKMCCFIKRFAVKRSSTLHLLVFPPLSKLSLA